MTATQDREPGRIVVRRQSLLPLEPTFRRRLVAWARVAMDTPWRVLGLLFPRQSAHPPFKLIPGFGARIELEIQVPGAREVHLFAETRTTAGGSALVATPAQVVLLDESGRGTATVEVSARDENTTGQAEVRVVAVRPEYPDAVAADLPTVPVAQEGTAAITYGVLIGLVILGGLAHVAWERVPILALMIVIALAFMSLNAPKFGDVTFEARRLLPRPQRLLSAGLLILGAWVWGTGMHVNSGGLLVTDILCGKETQLEGDCTRADILFDNLTAIVASMGLSLCVFLALAPAIRPRRLAGHMMLVAGLCPLLLYDLRLVGPLLPHTTALGDPETIALRMQMNYQAFGWTMAGVGILLMSVRHGFGAGWQKTLGAVTLVFCFSVLFLDLTLAPRILTALLLLLTFHALIVRPPGRAVLRRAGFAVLPIVLLPGAMYVLLALLDPDSEFEPSSWMTALLAFGLAIPLGVSLLLSLAVVVGLVDLSVWRWWLKRRSRAGPAMEA